jgi:hypothetical protein
MDPNCCFFVSWWWLPPMLVVAMAEEQAEVCLAKTCGNLTISNPFCLAGKEKDGPCGSLDFEVTCLNNTPVLRSSIPFTIGFEIIDISYEEGSLRVVDLYKQEAMHGSNGCQVPFLNTSVKLGRRFRIDPSNLNLVLYNCTAAAVARRDPMLVEMRCGNDSNAFVRMGGRYDGSQNYEGYYLKGCISTFLPVLGTSGEANANDYEQLIDSGFLLRWEEPPGSGKLTNQIVFFYLFMDLRRACSIGNFNKVPPSFRH